MLAQAIPMLSRCDLEALTERLIDRLDEIDGDPDLEATDEREPNGDEMDIAWPESGALLQHTGNLVDPVTDYDEDDAGTGHFA
ncbi:hypothetical protein [Novosphingobium sp. NDB2Meth1]|uniref:hypothetical protein n=1 Tax=Novosphingobium sp. NDB2Meth1 TaxID=1892847 RepID=UPI000A67BC97|nr:hypothetical protein [Novosphingobium sp. NDB2Meth1]